MPKWLVRLKGERFDLEDLPDSLCSPELNVIEESGAFYLQSTEFDPLTSADEVCERGKALIKLLNGVAKFHRDNFRDISEDGVTQIEDDGKHHHYVFLEGAVIARAKVSAHATVITSNGSERVVRQPSPLEFLLNVAQKHNVVADALCFYRDDTWISLYKVYEIVRDDIGGNHQIIKNGWAAKPDLSRFTQTAQSRVALGNSARHASDRYKPPAQPMSLSEARSLIKSIFTQWVSTKTQH